MAWNGSSEKGKAPALAPKPARKAPPSKAHGLVALVVIAAVGGLAVWWLTTGEKGGDDAEGSRRSSRIAEVKPQLTTNAVETAATDEAPAKPRELGPQKVGETRDGKILLPSGRLHVVKGVVTNSTARANKGRYEIFDHPCENEIACMLTLEPGAVLVGTPVYRGRFKRDFLKSLETPIVINEDDSEEDKELKRNVREAKIELKAALDRGEDIEQIMLDTRAENQKLALYKMELKRQLDDMRANVNDMTTDELEDLVGAANKMLEEKGIAPLKYGPLIRQKMLMMREKAKQENQ